MSSSVTSAERWLINNPQYIRSVSRASGCGGYRISLPKEDCDGEGIDAESRVAVLPGDLAGQLGMQRDPVFEIYVMPEVEL